MSKKIRKPAATRTRRSSTNIIMTVVILAVAIVVIGGVILFGGSDDEPGDDHAGSVPSSVLTPTGSHTVAEARGDTVTMVEFLDYQCPACAAYYQNVTRRLERDYAGRITFITRNFPLDAHPLAVTAAQAAEAAAAQGEYQEMYHLLYDNYRSWALAADGKTVSDDQNRARRQFDSYAQRIGLDLDRFHRDMASETVRQRIDHDRSDGQQAGVTSTPTIFVNGSRFDPQGDSFADVDRELRDMLDGAQDR